MANPTFAEIKARKKPVTKSVMVLMDTELADQIEHLTDSIADAKRAASTRFAPSMADRPLDTTKMEEELKKLQDLAAEDAVTFTFRSIGRDAMESLAREHPPSEEQKLQGAAWDPNTFAPALISLSCIEPEISLEEAKELWDSPDWNQQELLALFMAAVDVNTEKPDIPLSFIGSAPTQNSRSKSSTQSKKESPTRSS